MNKVKITFFYIILCSHSVYSTESPFISLQANEKEVIFPVHSSSPLEFRGNEHYLKNKDELVQFLTAKPDEMNHDSSSEVDPNILRLPQEVKKLVFDSCLEEWRKISRVCKEWKFYMDPLIINVIPKDMYIYQLKELKLRFPYSKYWNLKNLKNVHHDLEVSFAINESRFSHLYPKNSRITQTICDGIETPFGCLMISGIFFYCLNKCFSFGFNAVGDPGMFLIAELICFYAIYKIINCF